MIEFYGYSDGRAIAWQNHKNLMTAALWSLAGCIPILLVTFLFRVYAMAVILLFPAILLLLSFAVFLFVKYDTKIFLSGTKQKHRFRLQDGHLFRDNRELKKLSVFVYRNHLLLESAKSCYYVPNDGYISGNREQLLQQLGCTGKPRSVLQFPI